MELKELYDILKERYKLTDLLNGKLCIWDVLDDINVIDFLSCSTYTLEDVEYYILSKIK